MWIFKRKTILFIHKMKPTKFFVLVAIFILGSTCVNAEERKVLFYELGSSAAYGSSTGYSKLAERMVKEGYTVTPLSVGPITTEKLRGYDLLVIPAMGSTLTSDEMAAVLSFVMQDGKGLFITAGSETETNHLAIPFGIRIDASGKLEDSENQMPGDTNKRDFQVSRLTEDSLISTIRKGVNRIGFYEGSGLYLTGEAKWVATGSRSSYSTSGTFPRDSMPPVAAVVRFGCFGSGLIFLTSDPDMFKNENIEKYDNMKLAVNAVEWLTTPQDIYKENETCGDMMREVTIEKNRIEREMKLINASLEQTTIKLNTQLSENAQLTEDINHLRSGMFCYKDAFCVAQTTAAIILLGLFLLVGVIIYSSRMPKPQEKKGDELGEELGYEFEEPIEEIGREEGTEGKV
ncbi:MAG: hypothetical protein MSIBF_03325 [Candidatus Altiarchaeales archaeon IMC4]|nr:MAG: hypothetical protein MSIBF_03325 [Candidatus Altiarchaeales archaeon IMC4]